jgi:hypothetical protein
MQTAVFHDVLVLHRADLGWLCEIEDCRVFIARLQLAPETRCPRGPSRYGDDCWVCRRRHPSRAVE